MPCSADHVPRPAQSAIEDVDVRVGADGNAGRAVGGAHVAGVRRPHASPATLQERWHVPSWQTSLAPQVVPFLAFIPCPCTGRCRSSSRGCRCGRRSWACMPHPSCTRRRRPRHGRRPRHRRRLPRPHLWWRRSLPGIVAGADREGADKGRATRGRDEEGDDGQAAEDVRAHPSNVPEPQRFEERSPTRSPWTTDTKPIRTFPRLPGCRSRVGDEFGAPSPTLALGTWTRGWA